jgi:uncharacterized membrane protein
MAFCANCGAEVPGRFCPNCGTAVAPPEAGPSAGPTPGYTPPPPGSGAGYAVPPSAGPQSSGMSDNLASALCYAPFGIGLICEIVFLVAAPYNQNRTIRFNAFQGLFLHLSLVVLWFAFVIVGFILAVITHGLFFGVFPLFGLAVLVLVIFMMVKTYNNEKIKLPIIGDLAEKQV